MLEVQNDNLPPDEEFNPRNSYAYNTKAKEQPSLKKLQAKYKFGLFYPLACHSAQSSRSLQKSHQLENAQNS